MNITYSQCGDYLIPNILLPGEEQQSIGKYGRMRKRYLVFASRAKKPTITGQFS